MSERLTDAGWNFNGMGHEFDEHVAAHLPGYADVQRLVALIASFTVPDGGRVADLGCSTGLTAAMIHEALPQRSIDFTLYDSDESMLDQSRRRNPQATHIRETLPAPLSHRSADLTLALWLLQFLHPSDRRHVLSSARYTAAPNGCILIATKTRHADSRWEEIAVAALDDYKAEQGVTPEERVAKTRSLRGAMHTTTAADLIADLQASGWHSPTILWRWHVWSIIGAWAQEPAHDH